MLSFVQLPVKVVNTQLLLASLKFCFIFMPNVPHSLFTLQKCDFGCQTLVCGLFFPIPHDAIYV